MNTHVAFTLSMPNRGSWNGAWSGENNLYAVVKSFHGIKGKARAESLAENRSFYYRWDDGWGASIALKVVDSKEARRIRKLSKGFCGYEWMIESILSRGKILADHEVLLEASKL